jgi:hypothetical protein
MRKAILVALALAALLWPAAGQTPDAKTVNPMATAAVLIDGRGVAPVLRVVYDRSPVSAEDRIPISTTADIASDYVFIRDAYTGGTPPVSVVFDYRTGRSIAIDAVKHTFENSSLYAAVGFRDAEIFNRRVMRAMMKPFGIDKTNPLPGNPYLDQQELGVRDAGDPPLSVERKATAGGGLEIIADGINGGGFELSSQALSPSEMKGFARFLRRGISLHPVLFSAIIATGRLPSEISVFSSRDGKELRKATWRLVSADRTTATYPLSANDKPVLSDAGQQPEPLRSLLPVMLEAVAGRYNGGPRSVADYRAALTKALADRNVLQHYLLDNEFQLQYGLGTMACLNGNPLHDDCSQQGEIVAKWKSDADTMKLISAFEIEKSDPKTAIAQRDAIPRQGLSNAYILDLWNGDTMLQHGDLDGALSALPKAVRGNPYVGGFYKDLGDVFGHTFQQWQQWLCYDLARSLPGAQNMPVVDSISKIEKSLGDKYPEFF